MEANAIQRTATKQHVQQREQTAPKLVPQDAHSLQQKLLLLKRNQPLQVIQVAVLIKQRLNQLLQQ
jgi:hypothetical protein